MFHQATQIPIVLFERGGIHAAEALGRDAGQDLLELGIQLGKIDPAAAHERDDVLEIALRLIISWQQLRKLGIKQ